MPVFRGTQTFKSVRQTGIPACFSIHLHQLKTESRRQELFYSQKNATRRYVFATHRLFSKAISSQCFGVAAESPSRTGVAREGACALRKAIPAAARFVRLRAR